MTMTEDDIYRASTQYRVWSFTPEALASLRKTTNKLASERVIAAIKRYRAESSSALDASAKDQNADDTSSHAPIKCLSVEEEAKLLTFYCEKCLEISDRFQFPSTVKATAVQYMKRFYLSNSLMTYGPKQMIRTCLFLATKTENSYIALPKFAAEFPKTTAEDVIAPEFILTQGLRFTFDVRHPHRGLKGGLMELLAMAHGEASLLPALSKSAQEIQSAMLKIPHLTSSKEQAGKASQNVKELENRCKKAHDRARDILGSSALLTDAYFLYTPAQIWMTALLLSDEPLTLFYLNTKCTPSAETTTTSSVPEGFYNRLVAHLRTCATLLESHESTLDPSSREELIRIDKKLYQCQNPEKRDLVGLNRSQKRDGAGEESEEAKAKRIKKRKLEQERQEQNDVFGGPMAGAK